ncbi:MAG TPA: spore germination protein [Bacillales bacterium]|nr:spore germination protein [Bacillales bacterium]
MAFRKRYPKKLKTSRQQKNEDAVSEEKKPSLDEDLADNLKKVQKSFGKSNDLVIRKWTIMTGKDSDPIGAAAIYMSGLVDEKLVNDFVSKSFEGRPFTYEHHKPAAEEVFQYLASQALSSEKLKIVKDWDSLIQDVLSGKTVLFVDGVDEVVTGDTKGGRMREISKPETQLVIRGPKIAFTESIGANTAMIRRLIKSPNLQMETMKIGQVTQTEVALMYIKGIVNDKILEELKHRLNTIDTDAVLESGYVEQFIQDEPYSLFPTLYNTERPDSVAGNLLEGRVAIIVDGSPFVLVAPVTFIQFFQSPADYYQHFYIGTFLRLIRLLAYFLSLLTPALYIALITFHQEMIPTTLLISLAAQHEGVPFPAFIEAILMEITFEILREAGLRMPRAVGQMISIVGALVVGEAAVQAGIISAAMVIVVSITGIANFAIPAYNVTIASRLLRFMMMLLAGTFGLYGIVLGLIGMTAHMTSLRSFGIPYLTPFAPIVVSDLKDTFIRRPLWALKTRPQLINHQNVERQGPEQRPAPPDKNTRR